MQRPTFRLEQPDIAAEISLRSFDRMVERRRKPGHGDPVSGRLLSVGRKVASAAAFDFSTKVPLDRNQRGLVMTFASVAFAFLTEYHSGVLRDFYLAKAREVGGYKALNIETGIGLAFGPDDSGVVYVNSIDWALVLTDIHGFLYELYGSDEVPDAIRELNDETTRSAILQLSDYIKSPRAW